jgi:MFS family permease
MESYDVFLIGNFLALPAFKQKFGVPIAGTVPIEYVVETKWQSALQVSGQLGALIGVFVAGPLTSRIGYRYATLTGLMLLNAFIFIFYFANSMPIIFAAQILEGIPWGIFIANAPAYCSEIVPLRLRAPATQMLQMFWAIGSIIVGAVTYVYNTDPHERAYKIPIALQWMFPTPLAILVFFAPESPWWLVRKGKYEQAAHSVERLGRRSQVNSADQVSMMRRVIEMEASEKKPGYIELFKGTDFRRTAIVCGVYAAQNLTGNLIANQAVYFWTHHFRSTDDFRHDLLGPHHLLRQTFNLPVGFGRQHYPPFRPRYRCFVRHLNNRQPRPSFSWSDRFRSLHPRSRSCFLGHHRRNLRHPSPSSHYRYRSCHLLHCRDSLHFPGLLHAQPHWR